MCKTGGHRIACMALPVPPPDLEVPPSATGRCDPIKIFQGGSAKWQTPFVPKPVLVSRMFQVCQCVAGCCRVLQGVAGCCRVLQCVAVGCSVLQCVAVCCIVLKRCGRFMNVSNLSSYVELLSKSNSLLQGVPGCCGELCFKNVELLSRSTQCVAGCCSVLQGVAFKFVDLSSISALPNVDTPQLCWSCLR